MEFSKNYGVSRKFLDTIRSIEDVSLQRGIFAYYIDSAVHIKTASLFEMMRMKRVESGLLMKDIAETCGIDCSIIIRGRNRGRIQLPASAVGAFCHIVAGQSVSEALYGMPNEIMLPLNLAEVAYLFRDAKASKLEAAERIMKEHSIENTGMSIDNMTVWERIVEYNTDRGYADGNLRAMNLVTGEVGMVRKIQSHAKIEQEEGDGGKNRNVMFFPSSVAMLGCRFDISADFFLVRDYVLHNRIFIPGRFFTHKKSLDMEERQEVFDPYVRKTLGTLLCMPTEERLSVCGQLIAALVRE